MKIAFLSDTHFGYRIDNESYTDYVAKFYTDFFFPYLEQNGIKTVIQFGDLLDNRRHVSMKTLMFMNRVLFEPMKAADITMHTFLGNHDVYYKNTNSLNSPTYVCAPFDNVHVYDKITELVFDGRKFGLVPWINQENLGKFQAWLAMTDAQTCLGHFEFGGFEYAKGIISERGMKTEGFSKFDDVYSGHYHISSSKKNIMYLNTPCEMTFSDMGTEKGFYVYDTKKADLEFQLSPFVLFNKIIYDDSEVDFDEFDFSAFTGTYVKVYVIQRDSMAMYSRFIDSLYNAKCIDIQIIEQDFGLEDAEDVDVETQTTIDIIRDTVEALQNVDQAGVLKILDILYKEANLMRVEE